MDLLNSRKTKARKTYETYWESYSKGDLETFASTLDDHYEMIGTSETEVCHSKADGIAFLKAQIHEVVGKTEMRNRQIDVMPVENLMLINEQCDVYVLTDSDLPADKQNWNFYSKIRLSTILRETESGWKVTQQHGSFPDMRVQEGETLALEKINKENLELRDAVKRRTAELENKNRELAIEAALEKVRAVAMGMKNPEDMLDVCREISDRLQDFGVTKIRNVQTAIIDENIGQYLCYQYFTPYDKTAVEKTEYLKSPVEHAMVRQMLASRDGYFIGRLSDMELEDFRIHRKEENHFPDPFLDKATELDYCFLSIGEGGLGLTLYQPMAEGILTLFKRFHQVFSLAYQRFRDIQKAEAHARESEIDLALERVRAQTMAMHSSEDVGKSVVKMFSELTALGVDEGTRFGIGILNHDNENNQLWTARKDGDEVNMHIGNIDMASHPLLKSARKAWKEQIPLHKYVLEGEDLVNYYQMLNNAPDYKIQIPIEKLPKKEIQHCFIFEHGFFYAFSPREFQPELIQITKRFSSLFEQTYRRYLDLVRAEGQVREAEIELALERIRARAMAMHSSDELLEVANVMREQFSLLGQELLETVAIHLYPDQGDMFDSWFAARPPGHSGKVLTGKTRFSKTATQVARQMLSLYEGKSNEYTMHMQGELLDEWHAMLFKTVPDFISLMGEDIPKEQYWYCTDFSGGSFVLIPREEPSQESKELLRRSASVFDMAYTRFLDLQKAEAQAREAQIETALERVRSRSMAMHKSEELAEVSLTLFEQVEQLGIKTWSTGFNVWLEDDTSYIDWVVNSSSGKFIEPYKVDLTAHSSFMEISSAKKQGDDFFVQETEGETLEELYRLLSQMAKTQFEDIVKAGFQLPEHQFNHYVFGSKVSLMFITFDPCPEAHDIFKRFGKVFEQAYTRFLDLQKAEAQAREAQIEVALERVRAKAMAMQKPDELKGVALELRKQLGTLEQEALETCAIHLYEESPDYFISWAAMRSPKSDTEIVQTQNRFPKRGVKIIEEMMDCYHSNKKDYVLVNEGQKFKDFLKMLKELSPDAHKVVVNSIKKMKPKDVRAFWSLSDFKGGSLIMSTVALPDEATRALLRRFANVFSLAYQRFIDLQKAEAQTREAQINLAVERVRAKALAMHRSEEIIEVVAKLKDEVMDLNIPDVVATTIFLREGKDQVRMWDLSRVQKRDGGFELSLDIPFKLKEKDPHLYVKRVWENPENYCVELQDQKGFARYIAWLREHDKNQVADELKAYAESGLIHRIYHAAKKLNSGKLVIDLMDPPSAEIETILTKMGAAFDLAYKRFEDIQKAEAQARESQIQLALERVRARTMAMRHSEELAETSTEMFRQMQALGMRPWACGFNIFEKNEKAVTQWMSGGDGSLLTPFTTPLTEDPFFIRIYEARQRREELFVMESRGHELEETYKYMFGLPAAKKALGDILAIGFEIPKFQISHCAFFSQGYLMFITYEPYPEAHDIFRRFAKVFEQTYTRFLDLQKAEAQAREAQIELALESIRSRSLAMHSSEELREVVQIVYNQVEKLGFAKWGCFLMIFDKEKKNIQGWFSEIINSKYAKPFYTYNQDHEVIQKMWQFWVSDEETMSIHQKDEEKREYANYLFTKTGMKDLPEEVKMVIMNEPQVYLEHVNMAHGLIQFIDIEPFPKNSTPILKRITKEFEQAYTRFLDLQKAEGQAREARIETALEKVRSNMMAMHHGDQLRQVVATMFEQLQVLGFDSSVSQLHIYNEDLSGEQWMAGFSHGELPQSYHIPFCEHPYFTEEVSGWQKGLPFHELIFEGPQKVEYAKWMIEHSDYKFLPAEFHEEMLSPERIYISNAHMKYGFLEVMGKEPLPEKSITTLIRFAKVFEQTYTRFLDLQKAEAQAREAQIEAALERVRARTMAMHRSEDLGEVITEFFNQMNPMGLARWGCALWLADESVPKFDVLFTSPADPDVPISNEVPVIDGFVIKKIWSAYKNQLPHYNLELKDQDKSDFDIWLFEQTGMRMLPQEVKQEIRSHNYVQFSFISMRCGLFGAISMEPVENEKIVIVQRFAKVFEQTYTRFLDLKKAEAQAREARIEAALERVRSRSMAMQKTDDLREVVKVLFEQMQGLSVDMGFASVSIFIFEDGSRNIRQWLPLPDGVSSLSVPYFDHPISSDLFDAKESGEDFFTKVYTLEEKNTWLAHGFEHTDYKDLPVDFKSSLLQAPGYAMAITLAKNSGICIPSFEGKLPTPENIQILKRVGKVFEQAYIRFLDLQKAEAQAREAQIQLSLERARARSMAMQSSDELSDVLSILFQQFDELGIKPLNVWLSLYNLEENIFIYRATGTGGTRIQGQQVIDINAMDIWKDSVEQWKSGHADPVLVTFYPPEVLPQLMEVFKETFDVMPEEERMDPKLFPEGGYNVQGYTKFGYIGYNHLKPPTQEEKDILRKFATEFERVYQRFLDIEKAEAQAREAQIEAALERVRSASMAMHQTEDIGSVVQVHFEQLKHLDVPFEQAWITILHLEEGYFDTWFSPIDGIYDKPTHFKMPSAPFEETAIKNWKSGVPFSYLSLKTKSEVDQFLFACDEMTNSKYFSHIQKKLKIERLEFLEARHKFGFLSKTTLETPAKEDEDILLRFASVFEQTYTRFLDIQKAEAQAREAQIEAALEKVRSHSLAMQSAGELQDVVTIVGEKLKELGVVLDSGGVVICTYFPDSKDVLHWTATFDSSHPSVPYYLPYFDTPIWKETWHSKFETVDDFFEKVYSFEDKNHFFHYAFKHSDYKNLPDEYKKALLESETHALSFAWQTNSALMIASHNGMLLPEEHKIILKRFAKVFEQAFIRFMDLQKAEKQTRESQIELSLERVRAKAMAMHQSGELSEVLSVLFDQFDILRINPVFAHLSLIDLENDTFTYRMTGRGGKRVLTQQVVDLNARDEWKDSVKAFKKGKPNTVSCLHFPKEALPQIWELFNETLGALPKGAKIYQKDFPDGIYNIQGYCKYGYIGFNHNRPATEEEKDIVVRFATEFGRMYQRYLDIEKAEAQAREALIEASLERVRSRSMAMHQTDELNDVLCVLLEQFDFLGINPVLTHLTLFDEANEKFSLRLTTSPTSRILVEQIIDIYAVESWKASYENWKKGVPNTVDCIDYPPEVLPAVWEVLSEVMNALPEGHKINPEDFPNGLFTTQGHFKFGYLGFNHRRKATAEEKTLVSRFATEFGRAYQRFLDIQKAEAQAREAQIEAALERVRSRSMGMQNTTEMQQVANETREQLLSLGLKIDALAMSGVIDNEADYDVWVGGAISQKPLRIPYNNNTRVQRDYNKVIKDRPELFTKTYSGKIMKDYFRDLMATNTFNPEIEKFMLECKAFTTTLTFMKNSGMQMVRYTDQPFSDADNNIVIRFGKVFEQAYIRFLDLQKAEAQAREAQIEAALERVRSRTMAMQSSAELGAVAAELFAQMNQLVTNLWTCGFVLCEKDRDEDEWWLSMDGDFTRGFFLPNVGDFAHATLYEGWLKGEALRAVKLDGELLQKHYDWLMEIPVSRAIFEEMDAAGLARPDWQKLHAAYFSKGYLVLITREPCGEEEIFRRFAQVFDQTYTRFLDLQKAEAQTREAKIEGALEKVRSRTMGMQSSEELQEVANIMFLEIQTLDIPAWSCGYNILSADKKVATNFMSNEGTIQKPFNLPLTKENSLIEFYQFLQSEESFFTQVLDGKAIESHYNFMKSLPELTPVFNGLEEAGIALPTFQINHLCKFTHGYLLFITYKPVPDAHDIFKRFTKVFDQTYTRFLDLKKAEAQAREAQIANALEKVRSRSLAMQSPDELIEVAQLLREEMGALGVEELETSSIYIHDENNGSTQCWFTIKNSENPGKSVTDQMTLELQDTWVGRKMFDFYRSPSNQTSILMQGEQRIEWIRYCEEKSDLFGTSNFYGDTVPDRTYHLYKFSNGYIGAAAPGEISSESWELLKRATAVFSFAYTRFRDLQMAEANAQSALRQASLDRVRAEISSMRHTDDLDRITPLFFHELTKLGVPFIRCGVFIIQEKQELVEAYLSSPEGNSLGVLRLPYHASELTYQTVEAWRKGVVYRQHWNKEDFVQWINQLMEQDQIQDSGTYQGTAAPPESLDLHFVPFAQGMLYVGAENPLDEKELELVQALAKAFSIAYARYEDFVKLEQAKSEVESAMSELKATQSQLVQQEKLASLGQLTAGIAHEIKNPLNFVNNFSEVSIEMIEEILEERAKSQESRDENLVDEILEDIMSNLQKVHEHGTRANGIVTSMLQHSRGSSGKMAPSDLNTLIKEYVNLSFHGMRANKNPIDVEIVLDLDPEIKEVSMIKEDFTRVIINLCNNGFDAMRQKTLQGFKTLGGLEVYQPRLTVRTKSEKDHILISVSDNGPGIPNDIKDKILQPFFTTKKGTEGTGLGLSITHDIIKAHGGELKVESKGEEGAIFLITLPLS